MPRRVFADLMRPNQRCTIAASAVPSLIGATDRTKVGPTPGTGGHANAAGLQAAAAEVGIAAAPLPR